VQRAPPACRHKRGTREQQQQREHRRQVEDYKRGQAREAACAYCPTSSTRPRHLSVAIGQASYLMLVPKGRLVPGHCCIVPADHIGSTRQVRCRRVCSAQLRCM
jgi:hypothetical protein